MQFWIQPSKQMKIISGSIGNQTILTMSCSNFQVPLSLKHVCVLPARTCLLLRSNQVKQWLFLSNIFVNALQPWQNTVNHNLHMAEPCFDFSIRLFISRKYCVYCYSVFAFLSIKFQPIIYHGISRGYYCFSIYLLLSTTVYVRNIDL